MAQKFRLVVFFVVFFSIILVGLSSDGQARNASELRVINRFTEHVKRDGDTLHLRLKDGSYIVKHSGISGYYSLDNYFVESGFYLVSADFMEHSFSLMISDSTGEETWVGDFVHWSPDRRRITSVATGNEYEGGGVHIWRVQDGSITVELAEVYENAEKRYAFIKWKNNDSIMLTRVVVADKDTCPNDNRMTFPASLDKGPDGRVITDDRSSPVCGEYY